jgi:multidrug resistance efflux pump
MEEWVAHVNSEEFREQARKNQEANEAARVAQEERNRLWKIQRDEDLRRMREEHEAAVGPLKRALKAAGIKLEFDGYYEGAWMRYQIGDGPVVEVEEGLSAFEED